MARGYKQRFQVNADGSVDDGDADASARRKSWVEWKQAEQKAMEDFRTKLISAEDAVAQFAATVNKTGPAMGWRPDAVDSEIQRFRQSLGAPAPPEGEGKGGGTEEFDFRFGGEQISQKLQNILNEFQKGERTAEEATERMKKVLDIFGDLVGLTQDERDATEKEFQKEMGGGSPGSGSGGGGGKGGGGGGGSDDEEDDNGWDRRGRRGQMPKTAAGWARKYGGGVGKGVGDLIDDTGIGDKFLGGDKFGGMAQKFAGPLAIVGAGAKVMEAFYGSVGDATRRMTAVGQAIAKNDGFGAITGVMDGFGSAAKKVPIIGGMLQKQIDMYTQFIKSFDVITEAFRARGEELKGFSGPIAAASANARVEKLLADIGEAQRLGNEYADIIRQKTEVQVEFQKALEPIKAAMMQTLIPILRGVTNILKTYNDQAAKVGDDVKRVLDTIVAIADVFVPALGIGKQIADGIAKQNEAKDKEERERKQAMLDDLFNVDRRGGQAMGQAPIFNVPKPNGLDIFRGR